MCLDDSNEFRALPKAAKKSKDGFTLWEPVDAHYVTAQDVRAAMIAQSKDTKNGVVAPFRIVTTRPVISNQLKREPALTGKD